MDNTFYEFLKSIPNIENIIPTVVLETLKNYKIPESDETSIFLFCRLFFDKKTDKNNRDYSGEYYFNYPEARNNTIGVSVNLNNGVYSIRSLGDNYLEKDISAFYIFLNDTENKKLEDIKHIVIDKMKELGLKEKSLKPVFEEENIVEHMKYFLSYVFRTEREWHISYNQP